MATAVSHQGKRGDRGGSCTSFVAGENQTTEARIVVEAIASTPFWAPYRALLTATAVAVIFVFEGILCNGIRPPEACG